MCRPHQVDNFQWFSIELLLVHQKKKNNLNVYNEIQFIIYCANFFSNLKPPTSIQTHAHNSTAVCSNLYSIRIFLLKLQCKTKNNLNLKIKKKHKPVIESALCFKKKNNDEKRGFRVRLARIRNTQYFFPLIHKNFVVFTDTRDNDWQDVLNFEFGAFWIESIELIWNMLLCYNRSAQPILPLFLFSNY